jgi:plasmid replication initiation protein
MVGDNTIERSPLLPDRRTQGDFFVCDLFDAAPKGDMASMEHPVFSLSTRPDHRVRRYEHKGAYIEIKPSADGLATIHDRDILIYCTSQLMAALNDGKSVSQYVRFRAFDLLSATNRGHDGRGYEQLKAAFERLAGTRITTNITTGNVEILDGFGLIDSFRIIRATRDGRMQEVEIRLSDWVFNAIRHREVLTIHRDYFRLRKPLERRMYELARKHCGRKDEWRISLATLQKKCGSASTAKEFKRLVQNIAGEDQTHNHMPDYAVRLEGEDMLVFRSRKSIPGPLAAPSPTVPPLDPETYHDARTMAPGWDVHFLEQQWREWITEPPRDVDAAFLGFCRKWYEKRGAP